MKITTGVKVCNEADCCQLVCDPVGVGVRCGKPATGMGVNDRMTTKRE